MFSGQVVLELGLDWSVTGLDSAWSVFFLIKYTAALRHYRHGLKRNSNGLKRNYRHGLERNSKYRLKRTQTTD